MRSKNTIRLGGVSALRSPTAILTEVFVPAAVVSDVAVSAAAPLDLSCIGLVTTAEVVE
jgi:hypothetical protein